MPEFTIGNYLAARLEQVGIRHYFMVPGDYNLVLLDQLLANKNLEQVGDYTTAGWTGEPPAGKMITISARDVRFPGAEYTDVAMADFLAGLAKNVHSRDATLTQFHRIATVPAEPAACTGDASA